MSITDRRAGVLTLVCIHCKANTFKIMMDNYLNVQAGKTVTGISFVPKLVECTNCGEEYPITKKGNLTR